MKLIQIPSDISIVAGGAGEIIGTGPNRRIVLSLDYGSNVWDGGSCSIRVWDPPSGVTAIDTGKLGYVPWTVSVDGWQRFTGFLETVTCERSVGGYIRNFRLRDCLSAWDVLLTNKTYPDPPAVNTLPVTDALGYLIGQAASISGIPSYGSVLGNPMTIAAMYEDGVIEWNNTSYLAEIERICQNLGYRMFCDCAFADVRMMDMTAGALGSFVPDPDSTIAASYSLDATSIPATVLASDDSLGKGIAYGKHGTPPNNNGGNFALTGIDNLVWASTVGIAEDHLAEIAHKTYDVARGGSKVMTVVVAGPEATRRIIGVGLDWTGGPYCIYAVHTSITASEYKTTYQAWGT